MTALADLTWPRRTEHLSIRPATPADASACWAYNRRPEVAEWREAPATDEASFTARFVDRIDGQLVAELDGRVIADLGLRTKVPYAQVGVVVPDGVVEAELGWAFDPAVQGRGLATEAALELLAIAFDGLGARRVAADCFVANASSWRLMERIGLRREGHMVGDSLHRSGAWSDWYSYALLADEWRARPAGWSPRRRRRSLADLDWPRRTERLSIRPATADDAAACWRYSQAPGVNEWLRADERDEATFTAGFVDPDRLPARLVVERDGVVIGNVGIVDRTPWAQEEVEAEARDVDAELSWIMDPTAQGHGYATEAAAELVAIAFDGLGRRRVVAECFADNVASRRVMDKLGLRLESRNVRESLHRTRGWLDGMTYALLADEWRARPADWAPPPRRASLDDVAWPRRTSRLLLRRATAADAAAVWTYVRQPVVTEWLDLDADEDAFLARWNDPDKLPVRIAVERDGVVVGDVMVRVADTFAQDGVSGNGSQAEIGWTIDPAHHGRGYATEAAAELLAIAFDEMGLRRAYAQCMADNVASWRVMEKIGMRREWDDRRGVHHRTRGWVDAYEYALLADEWRGRPRT